MFEYKTPRRACASIREVLGIGTEPIAGDVNNDGSINASDVQTVINAVLGL